MFSPFGLSIDARERILRSANARFESIAPLKATHVNESSVTDARATPKTIGTSENATGIEMYWPRTMAESTQVKTGSAAFTIWVNETAPAPAETTAPMWPSACRKPIGASVASAAPDSRGGLRSPVSQSGVTKSVPTSRLTAECVHGSAMEFSRCLFAMLYPVDSANHSAKYTPSFAFFSSEFGGMTEQPSSSQSAVHSSVPRSPHVSVTDVTEPSSRHAPHIRLIASAAGATLGEEVLSVPARYRSVAAATTGGARDATPRRG